MFDWMADYKSLLYGLWILYIVLMIGWIILQKRSPVATLAWIIGLSFLPLLGCIIYYFFGPKKIKRQRLNRRQAKQFLEEQRAYWGDTIHPRETPHDLSPMARLIAQCTSFLPSYCTDFELLSGGVKTYEALFSAIEAAQSYVLLEYYIFKQDHTGTKLRDLLVKKARQGVNVYLLVDALGSAWWHRGFMKELIQLGGQVSFFHSITFKRFLSLINFRNHRKVVVVDGRLAFMGGVNIADDENRLENPKAFHDVHIQLQGPVVSWFELLFLQDWFYSNPNRSQKNLAMVKWLHQQHTQPSQTTPPKLTSVQVIASGPDTPQAPILRSMIQAMQSAKHCILLTTPYFIPDDASLMALSSAALRGVDVKILLPHKSDSYWVTKAAQSYYDELIAVGVHIYEYMPRMLHAKTLVVDNSYGFIGSANFDYRSFYLNFEVTLFNEGSHITQRLREEFEQSLQQARRVTPHHDGFFNRLIQATARLLSPLL